MTVDVTWLEELVRTSPTSRSPGSSSRTSRRCWPTPTRSGSSSTPSPTTAPAPTIDRVAGHRGPRVHLRRAGRLPARRRVRARPQAGQAARGRSSSEAYELEYGTDLLEIHRDARRSRASGCWSSTTCSPPAAPRRPPSALVERLGGHGRRLRVRPRAGVPRRAGALDGHDADVAAHLCMTVGRRRGRAQWPRSTGSCPGGAAAPAGGRGRAAAGRLPGPAPEGAAPRLITRAYERPAERPRGPGPQVGRALHPAPAGGGPHRRRARARRRHRGRRPAARRGGGHRRHPRATSSASSAPTSPRSSTASPSSSASSSTPRRRSRPPRCARCSWRWPRTSGS